MSEVMFDKILGRLREGGDGGGGEQTYEGIIKIPT
jgi:hypothetical protein